MTTSQQASKIAHRWTVGNLKGGTGKTTVAVLAALTLHQVTGGRVLLVDADSANETAWDWRQTAGESWPQAVTVVRWQDEQLTSRIDEAEGSFEHLVIDTGPHDERVLRMALSRTNLLVLPVGPTRSEVVRIRSTLRCAAEVGAIRGDSLAMGVLLTRTRANTNSRREVRAALVAQGLPVLNVEIPLMEAVGQAYGLVPDEHSPEFGHLARATRELMEMSA